jgi:ATP-dependent Clp protease ATP-binding subunit ClpA
LKRVIQREVSDPIALALLKGEYHDGDIVVVDAAADGGLVFGSQRSVSVD